EMVPHAWEFQGENSRPAQLIVRAHFANGSVRDVTGLAVFTSSDERVAVISDQGAVVRMGKGEATAIARYLEQFAAGQISCLPDAHAAWALPPPQNFVDHHVFAKLKRLGIEPSPVAGDQEFLRRASLDVIGTILRPELAREFLDSKDPKKRSKLT